MPLENVSVKALFSAKPIANDSVALGAYITYVPDKTSGTIKDDDTSLIGATFNPSTTTSWRVFKNNSGQLDIISTESVTLLQLGDIEGYRKVVYIMNELCSYYVNGTYATSARSLGCNSSNQAITADEDDNYIDDKLQLNMAGVLHSSGDIWLASRMKETGIIWIGDKDDSGTNYYVRYMDNAGNIETQRLFAQFNTGVSDYYSKYAGVRPIVSLKSNIKITGGDGTAENPYTISI